MASFFTMSEGGYLQRIQQSRHSLLLVVFIAIFLDNMLLTVIVPIMPTLLLESEQDSVNKYYSHLAPNRTVKCLISPSDDFFSYYLRKSDILGRLMVLCNKLQSSKLVNHTEAMPVNWTNENVMLGLMFASKAAVQLLVNPFVGYWVDRIGYSIPLFVGFIILFGSTLLFAFSSAYGWLFFARSLQGVGSSCSSVAGMGLVASLYADDAERGWAMGIALGGLALGVLVGPPFGGAMFEFVGRSSPFFVLAALALFDGVLQLLILRPKVGSSDLSKSNRGVMLKLLRDPYIIIAAGSITLGNMGIAMLEPSLPLYTMQRMNATSWEQGAIFLPASLSYLVGTNVFGPIAHRLGRWLSCLIGIVVIAVCMGMIPFAAAVWQLIFPNSGLGFAIGMVDASMMPTMGRLVDLRHGFGYGSVYSIADVAFCLSFVIGPLIGSGLIELIGFKTSLWIVAGVTLLYAPLLLLLRKPLEEQNTEQTSLLASSTESSKPPSAVRTRIQRPARSIKQAGGDKMEFKVRRCSIRQHAQRPAATAATEAATAASGDSD